MKLFSFGHKGAFDFVDSGCAVDFKNFVVIDFGVEGGGESVEEEWLKVGGFNSMG